MEKREEIYNNLCISIHNLGISLNENIYEIIEEVIEKIYERITTMFNEKYENVLFDEQLREIIKQSFENEKNKYLNKYDSINIEDIRSRSNYKKYLEKQDEKVKFSKKNIELLSNEIMKKIDEYLRNVNFSNLSYRRDMIKINKKINDILLKEIERYYLKTSKANVLTKNANEKVYNDIRANYSIKNKLEFVSEVEKVR